MSFYASISGHAKAIVEAAEAEAKKVVTAVAPVFKTLEEGMEAIAVQLLGTVNWTSVKTAAQTLENVAISAAEKHSSLATIIGDLLPAGTAASVTNLIAEAAVSVTQNTLSTVLKVATPPAPAPASSAPAPVAAPVPVTAPAPVAAPVPVAPPVPVSAPPTNL